MKPQSPILLTGAAGFIGSYLLGFLNSKGYNNITIVDDFSDQDKRPNYVEKQFAQSLKVHLRPMQLDMDSGEVY